MFLIIAGLNFKTIVHKNTQQIRNRRELPHWDKGIYKNKTNKKKTADVILNDENLKASPSKIRNKTRIPTFANAIQQWTGHF